MDADMTNPAPPSVIAIRQVLQNPNFRKNLQLAVMKAGEKLVPEKREEDFSSPEKSRGGSFEDGNGADGLASPVRVRPLKELMRNPAMLYNEGNDPGNQSDSESPDGSSHGRDDGYDSTQGTDEIAEAGEMSSSKGSPGCQNDSEADGLGQEDCQRDSPVEFPCEPTAESTSDEMNEDEGSDLKRSIAAIIKNFREGENSSQADKTSSDLIKSSEQKKLPRIGPASWKNKQNSHADIPDQESSSDPHERDSDGSSSSHPKEGCSNISASSTESESSSTAAESIKQKDPENPSEIQTVQQIKPDTAVAMKKKLPRVGPASWKERLMKKIIEDEEKKKAEANKLPQKKPNGRKRKVAEAAPSGIIARSESFPGKKPRKSKPKATQGSLKGANEPSPSFKPAKATKGRSLSDVKSENIQETEYDQVFDLPNKPELNHSNRKWTQALEADAMTMWEEMMKPGRDVKLLQSLMKATFPYRKYAYLHGEDVGSVIRNFPALQDYRFLKGDLTLLRKASWATLDLKLKDGLLREYERFNFKNYLADAVIAAAGKQLAEQSWNEELLRDVQLLCFGHQKTKGKLNKRLYAQRQEDEEPFKSPANTPSIDIVGELGHKDTQISVYCEGHLITKPPNFYEAVMSAYALYWLFNLQYEAGCKKLYEAFDSLIGEN